VRWLTACRKPATGSSPSRGYRRVSGKSARTTNAIERLHEEFKRRIKVQTGLPSTETAAMLFWALLASGQINMRKLDGWSARHKAHRSAN
jgi:transposase-like protein